MIDDAKLEQLEKLHKQIEEASSRDLKTNLGVVIYTNKNLMGLYLSGYKRREPLEETVQRVKKFYEDHKEVVDQARSILDPKLASWEIQTGWLDFHIAAALKTNNYELYGNNDPEARRLKL